MTGGGFPAEVFLWGFIAGWATCAALTLLFNRPSRERRRNPGGDA